MNGLKGPRILLDKDIAKWESFEREMLASVEISLRSLFTNLDPLYIPVPDRERQHKLVARDCFDTGHEKIIESLERVSARKEIMIWQGI
ncbi:hypothetical protein IG631_00846 [Alternaria alternata]|nr:hypothetical protein IG631_00846 [Alternaria alternata]